MSKSGNPSDPFDMRSMFEGWQKQFGGGAMTGEAPFLQQFLTMNARALAFVQHRVNQDIEATGKLMRCKSPTEAAEVMHTFYEDAFKDYAKHVQQLADNAMGGSSEKPGGSEKPKT